MISSFKARIFEPPSLRTRARTHSCSLEEATTNSLQAPQEGVKKPIRQFLRFFDPPCHRTRSRLPSVENQAIDSKAYFNCVAKRKNGTSWKDKESVDFCATERADSPLKFVSSSYLLPSHLKAKPFTSACDPAHPRKNSWLNHKRPLEEFPSSHSEESTATKTKLRKSGQGRGRPPPKPKTVPAPPPRPQIVLSDPPEHPLPQDVAVICTSKLASDSQKQLEQWCQVIDRFRSCGDQWMYYVHYAGTDRRLDEWVHQDRIKLSSARITLPEEFNEHTLATRSVEDQKFIEILQKTEKHMVHSHDFERNVITRTKTVDSMIFGSHEIKTWYFSPYPVSPESASRLLYIVNIA